MPMIPTIVIHNWQRSKNRATVAVSIYYDIERKEPHAPIVIGIAHDNEAMSLVMTSIAQGIPLKENGPLATYVADNCVEGEEIMRELYQAIAEVLSELTKGKLQF